ncbi:MAG TPA: RsmE family RNA methyltransferase [Phycisphaerae bacterium]|nr:RsmE family RNA methyltransferase [Phycisphaerae bacterium]HOJ76428.1 RsmE family RNA methyltransferase [Phycisphaerae bacterium]HOM53869.1 RsmE family RNA methyltransferase [Phycisphaerae bacterium]HON69194.1 RsmE family RNA methyltransferase [Phycisphaerae bacterium]HOQ88041.1 RsmE family RNA methyltransferase [Phycisphaerae bacterium]
MSLRCYYEDLAACAESNSSPTVMLSEHESRHARLSRRLSVGDELVLFDGRGRQAAATIAAVSKSVVEARVGPVVEQPRPAPALTLAVAMPKGPRQDVLIEKCTELSVAAIQPLLTERSVAGASDHKRDKWRRTTIEAAKQSGQCWLPDLPAPASLDQYLVDLSRFDLVLAAMLAQQAPSTAVTEMLEPIREARTIVAFVGPEGGWSPREADALLAASAVPVSLGPNVLRIETAAIALAALAHATSRV